jgi:hypothetical protein
MYRHGTHLITDADFDNAVNFGYIVSVTQNGEHLGSGHIISHSKNVIKMIDGYYFKYNCEFALCLPAIVKKSQYY